MEHQLIRKTCIAAIIILLIAILCLALVFGVNSAAAEEGGYDEFERTRAICSLPDFPSLPASRFA